MAGKVYEASKAIKKNSKIKEKYDILKVINTGGTSVVYLASDKRLNKSWAIKQIAKENEFVLASQQKEAEILKDLDHPCLPRVTDILNEEDDDYFYIVMDYVEGESLKRLLAGRGPFSAEETASIGIRLCEVLSYLHSKGIIYRDMKPSNVMLTPSGEIKLIDFGIARIYKEDAAQDTVALGTEGYAAPEQYEGKGGQSDERTDVYCLGVTLFQLATGQSPASAKANRFDIRTFRPYLSEGLARVILKTTEKDPEKRLASAESFRIALLNYEKLDRKYTGARRKVIGGMKRRILLTALFILLGIGSLFAGSLLKMADYNKLMEEGSRSSLVKAADIRPEKEDAYTALLAVYGESFTEEESAEIGSIFSESRNDMKKESRLAVDKAIGEKYLTSYKDSSQRERIVSAYPYFDDIRQNGDESFEGYEEGCFWARMGDFYKEYILKDSLLIKEKKKEDYEELFKGFEALLKASYEKDESANLRLSGCELFVGIIKEEKLSMKNAGVSEEEILREISLMEKETENLFVHHELLKEKKERLKKLLAEEKKEVKNTWFEVAK